MSAFSELFFRGGGVPRLQLGFDNPNKAAVLLGCLALVFAAGAFRARRRGVAISLGAASALSWCGLFLTCSRGGLVAFAVGLLVVLGTYRRRLSWARWLSLFAAGAVLAVAVFCCRGKAFALTADASVGNRLEIWRSVPRMMADALTGWGVGTAGDAYMGWYQPLRSHERYRTLVGSHQTWLVELGLWGRIVYCAAWVLVLGVCLRHWRRRDDPLPFAIWLAFALAGAFSSVAESPILWLVPVAAAAPAAVDFVRNFGRRDCQGILAVAAVWGMLLPLGLMYLGRGNRGDRVSLMDDTLIFGMGRPETWIVRDLSVMGGGAYGRALRLYAQQATNVTCGFVSELSAVPADARRLVLCGEAADVGAERFAGLDGLREIRVLSPNSPEKWLNATSSVPIRVFCGEFDSRCPAVDHPRLRVVDLNGAYLTQWPELALSPAERLISDAENHRIHNN